jgi:2-C-methyl-D-erythritol 4-phosphate cytidylyltransferase
MLAGVLAAMQAHLVSCRQLFTDAHADAAAPLRFAAPGRERQDSVFNGFQVHTATSAVLAGIRHEQMICFDC